MLVRVRTRDGTERIEVSSDTLTVGQFQQQLATALQVPVSDQTLSRDPHVLLAPDKRAFTDLADPRKLLNARHGEMLYLAYSVEREPKSKAPPKLPAGKMTIEELIARQIRIERQETPHCAGVSFDRNAANAFQAYVHDSLGFSIKRAGVMYGVVDEEQKEVRVEAIYEPPQEGTEDTLVLMHNASEEERVEAIASGLGLKRVGWIFTQMAELQSEGGELFVSAIVKLEPTQDGTPMVHFEAFQCSNQCIKLLREGVLGEPVADDPKHTKMNKEVILLGKDTMIVDNDFFLVPAKIFDHEGPLSHTFPVENRVFGQNLEALKDHLTKNRNKPYSERISDLHLLLFLSTLLDRTDMALLVDSVRSKSAVPEGYRLIIDSLAGVAS
eukprot:jgi/Chlat1/323/Chrsp1S03191